MTHDYLIFLVRTAGPAAVGALLAWLASQAGIVLDTDSSTALTAGVVALAMAGHYVLVRVVEVRWPWLGVLLGTPATPRYEVPARRGLLPSTAARELAVRLLLAASTLVVIGLAGLLLMTMVAEG